MHPSALQIGQKFLELYWNKEFKRILDVGARDINGSLRTFCPGGAEYIGVDLEGGAGVDVVLKDAYDYPFSDEHFDLIVSTSCFEHDGMFWLSFLEQLRVLSKSGSLYINAPSNGAYHGYPYDNWRFYPDASLALEAWARRNGREAFMIESFIGPQIEMGWNDCVMVFQKQVPANPEWRCVFDFFPGSYNIRKLGHQGVINFASHPQDEQIIWTLSAKVAELSALVDRHAVMNRDPELTVVGGGSPNPVPGDRIEAVGACPNFGKLMSGVGDFATRLAKIKSAAAVSFRWYAYHTL